MTRRAARSARSLMPALAPAVVLVAALAAGCSGAGGSATGGAPPSRSGATGPAAQPVPTAASASPVASPVPDPSSAGLPGQPYGAGPKAGAKLAVVGVASGHNLALRALPGTDQATVVAGLPSLARGLVATGRARSLPDAAWFELRFGAARGWSSARYLAWLGDTTDITADLTRALGPRATSATLLVLARAVARARTPDVPAENLVVSGAPTAAAPGELTLDVMGSGGAGAAGQRLHVVATGSAAGFTLERVELTLLCSRGLSAGRCA